MQKVSVILIDDLDPTGNTHADETVTFALDGTSYEIDLTSANAHRLRAKLKEFKQAARIIAKPGAATRAKRRNSRQANADPTLTELVRAWAVKHYLIPAGKRGRLATKFFAAYEADQAGDRGPLNKLLAIPHQAEEGDPGWNPDGSEPVQQLDHSTAENAASRALEKFAAAASPAERDAEAEARKHYRPITRSARAADDKRWGRRTGYGCERTDKIADWTLLERIEALGDQNLRILGMLDGAIALPKSEKVSGLSGSAQRLENLEVIEEDSSDHGWRITEFGRYAYKVRTSNG